MRKNILFVLVMVTVLFLIFGCDGKDESTNTNLSSISLSEGELDFSAAKDTYSIQVDSLVSEITVTVDTESSLSSVTINGIAVNSGDPSEAFVLKDGVNDLDIVVTAASGTTKTYTINVYRVSANAALSSITLSVGGYVSKSISSLSPPFSRNNSSYNAEVSTEISSLIVKPVAENSKSKIFVNGVEVESGGESAPITLVDGDNTITIIVYAEDETTKKYELDVKKNASKSDNADLAAITVSPGDIGTFLKDKMYYLFRDILKSDVKSISIIPVVGGVNATVEVNNKIVESGLPTVVELKDGNNIIDILVTAEDGVTKKTYTLELTRLSNNTNLSSIEAFDNKGVSLGIVEDNYLEVIYTCENITLKPTASFVDSYIEINGVSIKSGENSDAIPLSLGDNDIPIKVTSTDETENEFTLKVRRLNNEASISSITFPYEAAGTKYASNYSFGTVGVDASKVGIKLDIAHNESVKINDGDPLFATDNKVSTSLDISDVDDEKQFVITLVSEDGTVTRDYTLTLKKQYYITYVANNENNTVEIPQMKKGPYAYNETVCLMGRESISSYKPNGQYQASWPEGDMISSGYYQRPIGWSKNPSSAEVDEGFTIHNGYSIKSNLTLYAIYSAIGLEGECGGIIIYDHGEWVERELGSPSPFPGYGIISASTNGSVRYLEVAKEPLSSNMSGTYFDTFTLYDRAAKNRFYDYNITQNARDALYYFLVEPYQSIDAKSSFGYSYPNTLLIKNLKDYIYFILPIYAYESGINAVTNHLYYPENKGVNTWSIPNLFALDKIAYTYRGIDFSGNENPEVGNLDILYYDKDFISSNFAYNNNGRYKPIVIDFQTLQEIGDFRVNADVFCDDEYDFIEVHEF